VLKVTAVEESISLCHRLRNEVGSYALMHDSGFHQTDFLQCCKFAEGDSRILMQKMTRDRMRAFEKQLPAPSASCVSEWRKEDELCVDLQCKIDKSCAASVSVGTVTGTGTGAVDRLQAWDLHWEAVYALAEATMRRTMAEFIGADARSAGDARV